MKKLLALFFLSAVFLFGCAGNPGLKNELSGLKKSLAEEKKTEEVRQYQNQSPNEKAMTRELEFLRSVVKKTNPEIELAGIRERLMGVSERLVRWRLGPPHDSVTDRITNRKVWTYNLDEPSKGSVLFKSLFLPKMKVERTILQLSLVEGKVVDVKVGDFQKEVTQGVPGIFKLVPTAAMFIF